MNVCPILRAIIENVGNVRGSVRSLPVVNSGAEALCHMEAGLLKAEATCNFMMPCFRSHGVHGLLICSVLRWSRPGISPVFV